MMLLLIMLMMMKLWYKSFSLLIGSVKTMELLLNTTVPSLSEENEARQCNDSKWHEINAYCFKQSIDDEDAHGDGDDGFA